MTLEGAEEEEELQHLWMLPKFPLVIDWSCYYNFRLCIRHCKFPSNPVGLSQWICEFRYCHCRQVCISSMTWHVVWFDTGTICVERSLHQLPNLASTHELRQVLICSAVWHETVLAYTAIVLNEICSSCKIQTASIHELLVTMMHVWFRKHAFWRLLDATNKLCIVEVYTFLEGVEHTYLFLSWNTVTWNSSQKNFLVESCACYYSW